jgi:hypothetical protein
MQNEQQMINISGCDFLEFKTTLSQKFGERQFTEGFEIIRKNKHVVYGENGDQQLYKLLNHLNFGGEEGLKSFVDYCMTYLIV